MRAYICNDLRRNYQIIEAKNGQAGWESALEAIPDLVISDIMMPEMNGYQFCEQLKTDERTSHIPVILLTAKAGEESKIEGLEKPVRMIISPSPSVSGNYKSGLKT